MTEDELDEGVVLPDWAPDDTGDVLVRDGKWILIQDYMLSTREPMQTAVHLCRGESWRVHRKAAVLEHGMCSVCQARPPAAFEGFCALVEWDR